MKLFLLFVTFVTGAAVELTPDTWEQETEGKALFVKFFAPWCGHCKKIKPAWDALMDTFEGSEILVADVDCVEAGKPLCEQVGVKGFPTLKYGDPYDLQDYQGARDLDALMEFAGALTPGCNVVTSEHCTEDQDKALGTLREKTFDELANIVLEEAKEKEQANSDFKAGVDELQEKYVALQEAKDSTLKDIKQKYQIGLVKQLIKNTKVEL